MAKKIWAGLDVGVETTSICVIDDHGGILHEAVCPTKVREVHRELKFLKRWRSARVGLETGCGTALARGLRNLGYCVDVYEARRLSKFLRVRRDKTDAGDANGIAEAGRIGASVVSKVYLKSLECQTLASRLTIRRSLIRARVRAVNLLCRQLEHYGGRIRTTGKPVSLRVKVEDQLKALFGRSAGPLADQFRALVCQCENLLARQQEIDRDLDAFAAESEVCRRLMTVPGVGPICALTFFATVGDPERFPRTSRIGCYLGLTPRTRQSGLMLRVGRISKMGNRAARSALTQASVHFMRYASAGDALHAWASEIEQRRGKGRSRVALARKLAVIMLTMWKTGRDFEPRLVDPSPEKT